MLFKKLLSKKQEKFKLGFVSKLLLSLIIITICIFTISISIRGLFSKEALAPVVSSKTDVSSTITLEKIRNICELAAVRYDYSGIAAMKNNLKVSIMNNNIDVPFTEKGFIIKFNAYIKAGVDLINVENTGESSCKITLSKPKILENNYNKDDLYYYEQHDGLFNKLTLKDDDEEIYKEMKKYEAAKKDEIYNNTQTRVKELLSGFIKSLGYKDIQFNFVEQGN